MDAGRPAAVQLPVAGRRRGGPCVLLAAAAFAWLAASGPAAFSSAAPGLSRKQQRSGLHTRGNLPDTLEVPLDVQEPEPEPAEPLPERRVPYTLHIVSHFPNNKHLKDESGARKYIEKKIVNAFENLEDMIRHVELNLQVSENFHREKPSRRSGSEGGAEGNPGARMLAPYIFKVTVSLTNQKSIVLANAEKHAQPTFLEGLDHMIDVIRKSLKEEKDKMIQARKRQRVLRDEGPDEQAPFEGMEEDLLEEMELESDRKAEEMYRLVEEARA